MGVLRFIWPPQGSCLCAPDGGRLREDGTGDGLESLPWGETPELTHSFMCPFMHVCIRSTSRY